MRYSYGLQCLESRSMYEQDRTLSTPKFYYAYTKNNIGVFESHGMSYLETRQQYQKLGHLMGLEKVIRW